MSEAGLAIAHDGLRAEGCTAYAGVGSIAISLPEKVVSNAPIAARLGIDEDWIVSRSGIRERHVAGPGETVVTIATAAGLGSVQASGLEPGDLDLVLVATATHEELTPGAAPQVAERLGATRAGAIDVNSACAGFVAALGLAAAQVEAGRAENVLVIGAEILTRVLDHDDRTVAPIFGDGAGAAIVSRVRDHFRIGPMVLGADGTQRDLVTATRDERILRMKGPDTFRHAVNRLSEASLEAVEKAGCRLEDIDVFVYHQANRRILTAVGERIGLDPNRVVDCIEKFGNTSAASVPIAVHQAEVDGLLKPGSLVLLAAFGAGLSWAATVVEWGLDTPQRSNNGHGSDVR